MSERSRSLPPATLSAIVPPSPTHHYFHRFADHPFETDAAGFSLAHAWWLAELAMLIYGDEEFIRQTLDDRGVRGAYDLVFRLHDGPTRGGRALVIEAPEFALVLFRGTRLESVKDPWLQLSFRLFHPADFLTDIDLRLDDTEHVHTGFQRTLNEIWPALSADLARLAPARSGGGKPLWLAGHSLGAALATIAAARLDERAVRGLYTFGSPRVGDERFRAAFHRPAWRIVNNTDLVAHIPPPTKLAEYAHVGELKFLDHAGSLRDDPRPFDMLESQFQGHVEAIKQLLTAFRPEAVWDAGRTLVDVARSNRAREFGPTFEALGLDRMPVAAVADHMPIYYAIRLWNLLRSSESSEMIMKT